MPRPCVVVLALAVVALPLAVSAQAPTPPKGQKFTLSGNMLRGHQAAQRNLLEAAEKMADADYAFTPTPEMRPFGQLVSHVALSQFGSCAALKGEPNPRKDEKEETTRTKADAIALLKASAEYCEPILTAINEENIQQLVKVGDNEAARGLFLAGSNTHANEMYGTMAVYLRLKGHVPPTTERQNQQRKSGS